MTSRRRARSPASINIRRPRPLPGRRCRALCSGRPLRSPARRALEHTFDSTDSRHGARGRCCPARSPWPPRRWSRQASWSPWAVHRRRRRRRRSSRQPKDSRSPAEGARTRAAFGTSNRSFRLSLSSCSRMIRRRDSRRSSGRRAEHSGDRPSWFPDRCNLPGKRWAALARSVETPSTCPKARTRKYRFPRDRTSARSHSPFVPLDRKRTDWRLAFLRPRRRSGGGRPAARSRRCRNLQHLRAPHLYRSRRPHPSLRPRIPRPAARHRRRLNQSRRRAQGLHRPRSRYPLALDFSHSPFRAESLPRPLPIVFEDEQYQHVGNRIGQTRASSRSPPQNVCRQHQWSSAEPFRRLCTHGNGPSMSQPLSPPP
jgi:hypothetical protein